MTDIQNLATEPLTADSTQKIGSSPKRGSRILELDILRGIAILLVLGHHLPVEMHEGRVLRIPMTIWYRVGWTGVDLFFVLSGFLVGGLLFNEIQTRGSLDAKRFIIRRGFKIWPSYYLCITTQFAWNIWVEHKSTSYASYLFRYNALHVQNYAGTGWHLWSLAVEEHFYLMLPLLLLAITAGGKKPLPRYFPAIGVAVLLSCLSYRLVFFWNRPFDSMAMMFPTHIRMDSLFFGVLISYVYHYHAALFNYISTYRTQLLVASLIVITPFCLLVQQEHRVIYTLGYSLLYAAYGAILIFLITAPRSGGSWLRIRESYLVRLIAWIGTYSYSIYLWHYYIAIALSKPAARVLLNPINPDLRLALVAVFFVVTSVILGVILGKAVEIPMLHLRERMFPARSTAV